MAIINKQADLFYMFQELDRRLRRLESAKTFNCPVQDFNPPQPRNGDMWINTAAGGGGRLYVHLNGTNHVIHNF